MSTADPIWQELLTSALLGTERHPPALPPISGRLPGFFSSLDASDSQHFLLNTSAVVGLYRQAGRLPARVPAISSPACELDDQMRCPPTAAARLSAMLGGLYKDLIPEWLQIVTSTHKRVPEELLPELLAWGDAHLDQVDLLLPVVGKRGRWLAQQITNFGKIRSAVMADAADDEAISNLWQTENQLIRERLLRRTRRTNPSSALQLLQSTWQEDSAEERVAFLEMFVDGLSMADEPFLETALDDCAKGVRVAAADLLARLPASRLVQRQTERALALIRFKPGGFLRKAQVDVMLPVACDPGMIRDGVQVKRTIRNGLGEKADWLVQVLSAVPPSTWSQRWEKPPSELLDIAAEGEWQQLLHEGWIAAAGGHANSDWAEAILKLEPRRSQLLQAIPKQRRSAFLRSQLQSKPNEGMELLFSYAHPWGVELSQICIQHLRNYYLKSGDVSWQNSFSAAMHRISRCMDPALFAEAARKLPEKAEPGSTWEKAVENLLQTLDFRRQMREELLNA